MELLRKKLPAFTLIEILVAVAIIGVIAALVFGAFSGPRKKARDAVRLRDVKQIQLALSLYYANNFSYPLTLDALTPDYIQSVPKDPFGKPYHYAALGSVNTCGSYHLGADLEDTSNPVFQQDSDQPATGTCNGSAQDFNGSAVTTCGGSAGSDGCYDIVPQIFALQQQGITPPPPSGGQVAGVIESYSFSGSGVRPVFISADIQPRHVSVGDTQKLTVEVSDPAGILDVVANTQLDHSVAALALTPQNAQSGCTHCTWSGTWVVNDTSNTIYHTVLNARNLNGQTNSVTLDWSDPCSPPLNGAWTLDGNCSISGVNGVDGGNFTTAAGLTLTLTPGSKWAINSGFSIVLTPGSTIALGSGSQIPFTNLWIKDADGDGYAPNSTDQLAQDTQPATYTRRKLASGTADCDDTTALKWQNLTGYTDADGDTYTVGAAQNICSGASLPAGYRASPSASADCNDANASVFQNITTYTDADGDNYTANGATRCVGAASWGNFNCTVGGTTFVKDAGGTCYATGVLSGADCYDANANAKPGQTSFFTVNRGDGSFDYDCNGLADKQYTGTGPSCPATCCATNSAGSCISNSYTASQTNNGSSVACSSTVTTYASTACGSAGCSTSSVTQACR